MTNLENSITSYFGVIAPEDLKTIVSFFKPETIKKNDYFLKSGKSCDKLSFVQSGFLRIFVETEKRDVTQWITTQGYFVTDLSSFVLGSPSRWTIQALTDTKVQSIYKEDYQNLNMLVSQWPVLEKLFIVHCFTIMEDRIFSHLSMTAEERYQFFFEHNRELFNQVPLQYIASMLGMTPETFSRIRKKMQS
ncbi:hypothetical protein MYP_1049 [Sporocytophaga myxococcoides]|uniref:Cyclic nucleotide-binding domain-containing protein n=1 Tax=Sporocytophaga myxococcoides TaxID=153721 RepID=A0A098LA82_9BACT|nr:Crp/Fnr family transcriptional regulator [Sporocytophaga myxococcoides]GAL83821.1 hypothetical protein MYP_1049 [Sporocytophaga myxococcoides]